MIKINTEFTSIIDYETKIDNLLNILHQKSEYLRETYQVLLKENKTIDVITTDSFALQNNIFDIKIDNNKNIYNKISRHIYSDYYRFVKYIVQYVNTYKRDNEKYELDDSINNILKKLDSIQPYKINSPEDHYSIKRSQPINEIVVDILEILNKNYKKEDDIIKSREIQLKIGINIDTYIEILRHNNELLRSNIKLFNHFLERYNAYHIKYLSTLYADINSLYNNIITEINFNGTTINKPTNRDTIIKSTETIESTTSLQNKKSRTSISLSKSVNILLKVNIFSVLLLFFYSHGVL